jgi:hypothetical protein
MWAVDNPLRENATRGGDDFRWVEDAKGSAVPENRVRHSPNTACIDGTDESCAMLQAKS